ncbi:MAG: M3 family oligoendopeptidase [Erysipelotrichaceae bacterium]|nr:M3 family oligoendopeptidase [Erysipelotrichaceae bacterium]
MRKFSEIPYTRPDLDSYKSEMNGYIEQIQNAKSAKEQFDLFTACNKLRNRISSEQTVCFIRHSIDTTDTFYNQETEYWDEFGPLYTETDNRLYHVLLNSPYREQLETMIPKVFFSLLECSVRSFDPCIIEDLQQENKLVTDYNKLIASAKIEYENGVYNLAQMKAFTSVSDRDKRKEAYDARMSFFEDHERELDDIYDSLVKVRTRMAQKLGYENYIPLGYYRMSRLDYDKEMVASYRRQILEDIVPLTQSLRQRQKTRLGYDRLHYYDEDYQFASGNPKPIGSFEDTIRAGQKMYHELSEETGTFIDAMMEYEMMDLVSKAGKESGGYSTYIQDEQAPFIFSNFNGTDGDVNVLTHEAGHAFQSWQSRRITIPELSYPTMESCEIHSMSMEFFTHPWMELFFGDKADQYRFMHAQDALTFLPYGVLVDHFQHVVYENPKMTPGKRKAAWRELEKQYLPHKDYEGCDLLERGGWWYQQGHIFAAPFYYIDYTLAQVCALQFFVRIQKNDPDAWNDYVELCKVGGTQSFVQLCEYANLKVPFEDGCIKDIADTMRIWLDSIDDSEF